jgi:hypothetical protein
VQGTYQSAPSYQLPAQNGWLSADGSQNSRYAAKQGNFYAASPAGNSLPLTAAAYNPQPVRKIVFAAVTILVRVQL